MRVLTVFSLLFWISGAAFSQDDPGVVFEAASIKPFPEGSMISMSGCQGGPGSDDPGRINCEYASLKMLLMRAYQVKNQEIFGPAWLESEHFNITAKVPRGTTKEQAAMMFRHLLAERFGVVLHHENRQLPAYALTVSKGGLKIQESSPKPADTDDPPAGGKLPIGKDGFPVLRASSIAGGPITLFRQGQARLQASNTKLSALAEALSHQLDRMVTDETGLDGKYDITLYWTPDRSEMSSRPVRPTAAAPDSPASADTGTSIFTAVEQQLGLRLVSKKIPRDTIVVDRAEKVPTEN